MAALRADMTSLLQSGKAQDAIEALLGLVEDLGADVERLTVKAARYAILLFGKRSERLTKEELKQLALAFGATEEQASQEAVEIPIPKPDDALTDDAEPGDESDADAPKPESEQPSRKGKHPGRTRLSDELKREITETAVPDSQRCCIQCRAQMKGLPPQKHQRIEYVPAQIVVHEEHRETLVCDKCRGDATTAPRMGAPALVGRAGASVVAQLIEAKCDDCLPISRQCDFFERLGWKVPKNTLYGYWSHGLTLLEPVAEVVLSSVLGGFVAGIDDTRLDFLDEEQRSQKRRGHLWCFANKGGMLAYAFTKTWEAQEIAPWMHVAEHFIQVDDYKGYASLVEDDRGDKVPLVPEDRRLGCGMHIRRRYFEAFRQGDCRAALPISYFKSLYEIEEAIRGLTPGERLRVRAEKSIPILDEFDLWLERHKETFRPTELLAEATRYHDGQKVYFRRCFSDGRFEIDNGDVERGMRRVGMGRRNWLFTGASTGGPRLATGFTLVQSCRRLGLPTRDYLIDVLSKIDAGWPVARVSELTPERWGIERQILLPR